MAAGWWAAESARSVKVRGGRTGDYTSTRESFRDSAAVPALHSLMLEMFKLQAGDTIVRWRREAGGWRRGGMGLPWVCTTLRIGQGEVIVLFTYCTVIEYCTCTRQAGGQVIASGQEASSTTGRGPPASLAVLVTLTC